jgi:thiamine pyrophosphate-dependent acetolactate synthase large subunit-like protein
MKQILLSKTQVMKKTLSVITIAAMLAACGTNPDTAKESNIKVADTVGLAEYQAWKTQKEMAEFNAYKQSSNSVAYAAAPRKAAANTVKPKARSVSSGSGSASTTTSYPAKAPEKKGWSKAAKGTAIGAGGGAILGAVINKRNRAVGAVIGGVAGGAVGYGIGRHMDKKDGRY